MEAKLNPIIGSSAGTPLTGKSVSTQSGEQAKSHQQLKNETVSDTLETTDREADGRQPYETQPTNQADTDPPSQGGLIDFEG